MPSFDRITIVRGPCKITYDAQTFYSKGGVTLTVTNSTFDKETDAYGTVSKSKTDLQVLVEFEPVGEIEALSVLFPYGNTAMGASVFGATDKALVIVAADATYTVKAAAVTQMPSIRCTANNTAFGSVQFTGLLSRNGDPFSLTDYFEIASGASIGAAFDPSKLVTAPYTAFMSGLTGPDPIEFMSEAGFEVSFELGLNPIVVDGIGTVDMSLQNLGATIACIPTGVAQSIFDEAFNELDAGADLRTQTLQIVTATPGGLNFNCAAVQMIDLQRRFSPTENRLGQLTLAAKRTFSTGNPVALFTVAAVS
jgi:hypothetical protein